MEDGGIGQRIPQWQRGVRQTLASELICGAQPWRDHDQQMGVILQNAKLAIHQQIPAPAAQANQVVLLLAQVGKREQTGGTEQLEDILQLVTDRFHAPEKPFKRSSKSLDPQLSIQEDVEGKQACNPSCRKVHRSAAVRITHGGQVAGSDA